MEPCQFLKGFTIFGGDILSFHGDDSPADPIVTVELVMLASSYRKDAAEGIPLRILGNSLALRSKQLT